MYKLILRVAVGGVVSYILLQKIPVHLPDYSILVPIVLCAAEFWIWATVYWICTLIITAFLGNGAVVDMWIATCIIATLAYAASSGLITNKRQSQASAGSNNTYVSPKPSEYPQKTSTSNNYEPAISKALDLANGALKRDKTPMEYLGGALQGDFSGQKYSKAKVGAALAVSIFAAVAASAKVSETTTRAGVENQFDFGKKKLEDEKSIGSEDRVRQKELVLARYTHQNSFAEDNSSNGSFSTAINNNSKTLIDAARDGKLDIVRKLLIQGVDVNMKGEDGGTALLYAAGGGRIEIVRELLKHGAEVNAKSNTGNTALTLAAKYGHAEVTRYLLNCGADFRNVCGKQ